MSSRRLWVSFFACAATLALAAPMGGAGASSSTTSASGSRLPVASPLLGGQRLGATAMSSGAAVSCYSYDVPDRTGDTTGGLDGTDYRLTFDCVHHAWTATLTTAQAFSTSQLGDFEVDFDTDNNMSDGCHGWEWSVFAGYVPAAGGFVTGAVHFAGNCTGSFWGALKASRSGAHDLSLTWPDWFGATLPQTFRSVAFVTGKQNPANNSDFDALPNASLVISQRTTTTSFSRHTGPTVDTAFTQVVSGDFNGDGRPDMLFYGAGGHPDYVWFGKSGGGFTSKPLAIWGTYTLIPGDFNGDGVTDLLLYAPGTAPDAIWFGSPAGNFTSQPLTINGVYEIVSADFNGDHRDDLMFYAPGIANEYVWFGQADGSFQSTPGPVLNNPYKLAAGDFNGDGYGDVLLFGPNGAPDHVLMGSAPGTFAVSDVDINGDYSMLRVGDFNGDTLDDVLLFSPGTGADAIYYGSSGSTHLVAGPTIVINEDYEAAVVGDFNGDGPADIYFQAAGAIPDALWLGLRGAPTKLSFNTFGAIAVDPSNGHVFVTSGPTGSVMTVLGRSANVMSTITGLNGPFGVAFGPSTVYVAMNNGHSIAEFDRTTLAPAGTIDTGLTRTKPASLAYQHGRLWFTFGGGGSVGLGGGLGVWDPGTNTVSTAATDVTGFPQLASGTDGTDTLFVWGDGDPPDIARYDISTGSAVRATWHTGYTNSPGENCQDMTLSPDAADLWTSCGWPYHVNELDASTLVLTGVQYNATNYPNSVVATGLRGGWVVGGVRGYYANDVYIERIGTPATTVRSFELNSELYQRGLALSPDGRILYSASSVTSGQAGPTLISALPMP